MTNRAWTLLSSLKNKECSPIQKNADLLWAAQNGHITLIQQLINAGADVNSQDQNGNTALILATLSNYLQTVHYLLSQNALVDIQNTETYSALMIAAYHHHTDILILLITHGANINLRGPHGHSALCLSIKNNHTAIAQTLIQNHAALDLADHYGNTPLLWAIQKNNLSLVQQLLTYGADINLQNKQGYSPLIWAVKQKNALIIQALLTHQADINLQTINGDTALIWAIYTADEPTIYTLLSKGADPTLSHNKALMLSKNQKLKPVTKLLKQLIKLPKLKDTFETPLMKAIQLGYQESTALLITMSLQQKTLHKLNTQNKTALDYAIKKNNLPLIAQLLSLLLNTQQPLSTMTRQSLIKLITPTRSAISYCINVFHYFFQSKKTRQQKQQALSDIAKLLARHANPLSATPQPDQSSTCSSLGYLKKQPISVQT